MTVLVEINGYKVSLSMMWIRDDTPFLGKVAKGVVLLVPVFNSSERCWKVWEKAIYRLDPLPEKVIFLENNSRDNTLELITNFKLPHEVIRVWFKTDAAKGDPYGPIAHVRDLLLTRARTYGAKMAIFLDDDCIPERRDFIQRFLDNNLDICGGTYTRDFPLPQGTLVATLWDISMPRGELPKTIYYEKELTDCKVHNSHVLGFRYEILERDGRTIFRCSATSAGALALGERILQDRRLNFYPLHPEFGDATGISEDFGFCFFAETLGYRIFLDFTIKFAHLGAVNTKFEWKERPWAVYEEDFKY